LLWHRLWNKPTFRSTRRGHPTYLRSKGTRDQSMSEKREVIRESDANTPRKTCAVWPRLHCLKSNPDRAHQPRGYADYRPATALDGIIRLPTKDLSVGYRAMSSGVRMSGRPNPRYSATEMNFRIAYGARALWRRSPNSSPSPGKPGTWRSGAGVLRRPNSTRYA